MPLFTHPAHITTPAQQVATSPPRTVAPLPRTITPPPRPVTPPPRIITPPQTVVSPPRTVTPPPQTQAPKPITIQKPPTPSYFSSLAMGDQTFLPSSTYTPPPPIQTQTPPPQLSTSVPTAKILEHTKGNKTMDAAPTYNYATTKGYSTMYNIPAYASPVTVNGSSLVLFYMQMLTLNYRADIYGIIYHCSSRDTPTWYHNSIHISPLFAPRLYFVFFEYSKKLVIGPLWGKSFFSIH